MAYFLFFYNIISSFASLYLCWAYASLFRTQSKRTFLFVSLLFGAYFLDIIVLYMYDYIPEFEETFQSLHAAAPYAYSSLSFIILLLYRLIVGGMLRADFSHLEVSFWIACCVGAFCSWFIADVGSSLLVELVFAMLLRGWIVVFAVGRMVSARARLDRTVVVGVGVLLAVFAACEAVECFMTLQDAADLVVPLRQLPMEILGSLYMAAAVAYLLHRKVAARKRVRVGVVPSIARRYGLTKREAEILGLLAEGLDNRQISEREYISIGTVKTHVHNVCAKLGVESRLQIPVFLKRELCEALRRGSDNDRADGSL